MKTFTIIVALLLLIPMSILTVRILKTKHTLPHIRHRYMRLFSYYFIVFLVAILIYMYL